MAEVDKVSVSMYQRCADIEKWAEQFSTDKENYVNAARCYAGLAYYFTKLGEAPPNKPLSTEPFAQAVHFIGLAETCTDLAMLYSSE